MSSSTTLPFSKRTSASVVVFASLQASKAALKLTCTAATKSALNLEKAQLFKLYRQIIHQDVANQAALLATYVDQAVTTISSLLTTVGGIASNFRNQFILADLQLLVLNAYHTILAAQAIE